jgi:hypothetical protein
MSSNKVITAISSLVENVILDPSDVVCIDTENNVIGIGTSNPDSSYGIHINDKGIKCSKITLTGSYPNIGVSSLSQSKNIQFNSDVCFNLNAEFSNIITNELSSNTITSNDISSNIIYCNYISSKDNENITFNNNIIVDEINLTKITSDGTIIINKDISCKDISCNDISCNILDASTINVNLIEGDISFVGLMDFSGHLNIDGSLNLNTINVQLVSTNGSDDRLKHNEKIINNGLEIINKLEPQVYQKTRTFKDADFSGIVNEPYVIEAGLIAQDVEKIEDINFTVNVGNDTTPYSLNYNSIFVYGLAAIKELDNKLKDLSNSYYNSSLFKANPDNVNLNNIQKILIDQSLLINSLNEKITYLENKINN